MNIPYTACDNDTDNACDDATLVLTTTVGNTTTAEDDVNQTLVDIPVNGDISTNDSDAQGDAQRITSIAYDSNGDGTFDMVTAIPLGGSANTQVSGYDENGIFVANAGTVEINDDGTYVFTPASAFTGTINMWYQATDDNGNPATDAATLAIDVTGQDTNDLYPPIALDDNATTEVNTNVDINILTNDSDIDGTIDSTSVDLDPSTPGIQKSITIPGEGTYNADPTTGVVTFVPVADYTGSTTPLPYTVCDNDGLCTEATITVEVVPAYVNTNIMTATMPMICC